MHLRPMLRSDLPDIADISAHAFGTDAFFLALHPGLHQYPRHWRRYCLLRVTEHYLTPGKHGFVCVSDHHDEPEHWSGEEAVIGYAFWERQGDERTDLSARAWRANQRGLSAAFERFALQLEKQYTSVAGLSRSVDPENMRAVNGVPRLGKHFEHLPACWHLVGLAVAVEHQRRGVGGLLIDWGIEWAKREQLPAVLGATAAGERLYRRKGFRLIDCMISGIANIKGQLVMVRDDTDRWTRPAEGDEEWIERDGKALQVDVVWSS